jgi:hypothetical protein
MSSVENTLADIWDKERFEDDILSPWEHGMTKEATDFSREDEGLDDKFEDEIDRYNKLLHATIKCFIIVLHNSKCYEKK